MITRDQALTESEFHAEGGCILDTTTHPRGGRPHHKMEIWRRSGQPKTWKTRDDVQVPVKYGMYDHSYVKWPADAHIWHVRADCPVLDFAQSVLGSVSFRRLYGYVESSERRHFDIANAVADIANDLERLYLTTGDRRLWSAALELDRTVRTMRAIELPLHRTPADADVICSYTDADVIVGLKYDESGEIIADSLKSGDEDK